VNVAVIPPGGIAAAHIHVGFDSMLLLASSAGLNPATDFTDFTDYCLPWILEGRVRHEFGDNLAHTVEHQAGTGPAARDDDRRNASSSLAKGANICGCST
jgi:hypothetical protein